MSTISVSRHIHLTGGLRAGTNKDGKLTVYPFGTTTVKSPIVTLNILKQREYVGFFRSIGLDMVGFENMHTDAQGFTHAKWLAWDPAATAPQEDLHIIWMGIVNAYRRKGEYDAVLAASNVTFSLQATAYRLRDISEAYTHQNVYALCHSYAPGTFFKNYDTMDAFLALHSFLVEMGALRDYIAQFLVKVRFDFPKITSMSALWRKCRGVEGDVIANEIVRICDKSSADAWMATLSALRDRVVHVAPISMGVDFSSVVATRCNIEDMQLPSVYLGLTVSDSEVDALTHCVGLFRQMADFLRLIAKNLDVRPRLPTLVDVDGKMVWQ
jgi:hypothetical protein